MPPVRNSDKMATALHNWLSHAQESTRYDSVAAKYGLVVDTPSGMSQTGQNALRFLRSLSEHSPTFFEGQARLLSPPTPDLLPTSSPHSPPHSALTTPMSGPLRPRGLSIRNARYDGDDALFALDMPTDDPMFVPAQPSRARAQARPYPVLPRIQPDAAAPSLGSYFPPAPSPSPALEYSMYTTWDKPAYPQQPYPNYASPQSYTSSPGYAPVNYSQQPPQKPQQQFSPPYPPEQEQPVHPADDANRARMSALMYGSMRARAVVAATEDGQGW